MKLPSQLGLFLRDENGQDIIEYALLLCFMALGTVTVLKTLANSVGNTFAAVGNQLNSSF